MFDQILQLVKEHMSGNPQLSSQIPEDKRDAINNEIAQHVTNGLKNQASQSSGGGLLSMLGGAMSSGSPIISAIEGGLVGSLGNKFGLSSGITGAIAAALPGLLQKFTHKVNDPNDSSITPESLQNSLGSSGGLGSLFNR